MDAKDSPDESSLKTPPTDPLLIPRLASERERLAAAHVRGVWYTKDHTNHRWPRLLVGSAADWVRRGRYSTQHSADW